MDINYVHEAISAIAKAIRESDEMLLERVESTVRAWLIDGAEERALLDLIEAARERFYS